MFDKVGPQTNYMAGEQAGAGVYRCNSCYFSVVLTKKDKGLPVCPCCENPFYTGSAGRASASQKPISLPLRQPASVIQASAVF